MLDSGLVISSALARAGRWFGESGIRQPRGGIARYYDADTQTYQPVSTEITGYAASTLVWLFRATQDERYLDAARETAQFLTCDAWDAQLETFPFELPPRFTYFFDCGIIVRGLIDVWRETQDEQLIDIATKASHSMLRDFRAGRCSHPILTLPDKRPVAREPRWSREPGCYQLKAALAWWELAQITHDHTLANAFKDSISVGLASHESFLPGTDDRYAIMDRLHAYCYFLEGLTLFLEFESCARAYREGIDRVSNYLRDIAPDFARSDVYAQLLRARLLGMWAIPLDREAAAQEAAELAQFQLTSSDPRIDGAWTFGRRDGELSSHINPVSTAFAIQALELWRAYESGNSVPCEAPI